MPSKREPKNILEIIAGDLFAPDDDERHSILWWALRGPGKIILWLEYMFPDRIVNAIGSARRKRSPIIQVWYSIIFYIVIVIGFIMIIAAAKS